MTTRSQIWSESGPETTPVRLTRAAVTAAAAGVMAVGGLSLALWMWGRWVPSGGPTGPEAMTVGSALGFLLSGGALWLLRDERGGAARQRIGRACAVAAPLFVLLAQFLAPGGGETRAGAAWLPLVVDGCFLLAGTALVLLDRRSARVVVTTFATSVHLVGVLTWISYLYHLGGPTQLPRLTGMSMTTAAVLGLLGAAILAARPSGGVIGLLTSPSLGGRTARRLLPAVLLLPPVLGWLRLGAERLGWVGPEVGVAVLVMLCSLVVGAVGWRVAANLDRVDQERSRAADEVLRREQAYRRFMDGVPVAAYTTDAEGTILMYNQVATDLWGRSPGPGEKFCGSFRLFTTAGQPIGHDECPMARAIRENRPYHGVEAQAARPDGSRFNFMAFATPFRDASGALIGAMNAMVDITGRMQAEKRIERLNRTYTVLSGINQLIVRERDLPTLLTEACRLAVASGGFSFAWIGVASGSGGPLRLRACAGAEPDAAPMIEAILRAGAGAIAAKTQFTGKATVCNDTAAGAPAAPPCQLPGCRALVSLPLTEQGFVTGTLNLCVGEPQFFDATEMRLLEELASDISLAQEIIRVEAERRRASRNLQEEQALYAALVGATSDHIYFKDRDSRFVRINPSLARHFGLANPVDATGRTDEDFFGTNRFRRTRAEEARIMATGEPLVAVEEREDWPDGRVTWASTTKVALRDDTGRITGLVGISRDITERKVLDEQFLRAQRLEAIGTLAGGVSHDLNNILAPMLMAAGLLRDKLEDRRDREILAMVETGAERGANIIRQLLTFSRGLDGERICLQPRHLLTEMAHLMRETFPRNIELVQKVAGDLACVLADTTQLHQILMNLCVNARDAMPQGGRLVLAASNVQLTPAEAAARLLAGPGLFVAITVADTGHGIPPEIKARIFEPFFTTKGTGKGTGLGLSTVVGIAKSHGGFVDVESEPGQGAAFTVCLPASSEPAPPAEDGTAEPLQQGQQELILVVDDEADIRDATRRVLESHRYRVLTAKDGKEALRLFVQHGKSVRLVLTDLMMPEMGGMELIRGLRVLEPGVRVVASSGLDDGVQQADLAGLGIHEILTKPFAPHLLLATVARVLDEREATAD